MIRFLLVLCLALSTMLHAQELKTPLERYDFSKVSSHEDIEAFVSQLDQASELLTVEEIGRSVQGRSLFAMYFSSSVFGEDNSKIKVLIFAQQHGNEQSGKEGALMLAAALTRPENAHLLKGVDLVIVPQVNPDGSEVNQRRNANNADLNRNHLILTEPETIALHQLFDRFLFEVTADVHEYSPYSESWMQTGYRKNSDVTVGTTTNINIPAQIRDYSIREVVPFMKSYLAGRGFSSFDYCPGGPPEENLMRFSTFDINDGRQSLGIQNTLSFIQEGMNGEDDYIDNIQHRALGQMTGMMALLEFVSDHRKDIRKHVTAARNILKSGKGRETISIQLEHRKTGDKLSLPVYSLVTGDDSTMHVGNFHPVVASLFDVKKPAGYLIPADSEKLVSWAERQALSPEPYQPAATDQIEYYSISSIDSIDFEGDWVRNPAVDMKIIPAGQVSGEYLFISCAQLKGNLAAIALEPKSMLGLVTYELFGDLLLAGKDYPVLRVIRE